MSGALLSILLSAGGAAGTVTVGTAIPGGENPTIYCGYDTTALPGSAIVPQKLAGATIHAFSWNGVEHANGVLTLVLVGNYGGATHRAVVRGTNLGLSGSGVYNSTTGLTTFTWPSAIQNPFGIIAGLTIPCALY